MAEPMCTACGANWPNAGGGLCAPCATDRRNAARAEQAAKERERIAARRLGRTAWRPEIRTVRNHGHGTERLR